MDSILIVEPDSETLDSLARYFKEYEIQRATNRMVAIAELNRQLPDLILMNLDLLESEIDGGDLAQRLKDNKKYKQIPIILMSEDTDEGVIESLLQRSGADDFISTPVDAAHLLSKVQHQLDEYRKIKQRSAERHVVRWRTDYHPLRANEVLKPQGHQVLTINISEGGHAFLPSATVNAGDICVFAVYVSGQHRPFLIIGKVAWVKPVKERHVAGVMWLFWESDDEKKLAVETASSPDESRQDSEDS